ncbi:MAG: hypothetical protein K2X48_13675 [Chitinophagaceae bacterium]|nr:hypothetical protein [Chitinophagaceae bacterium]
MIRISLFMILLFNTLCCWTQQSFSFKGFVISETDSKPIHQASITIKKIINKTDTQTVAFGFTNVMGAYSITASLVLDTKEVVVSVSHISYEKQSVVIKLLPSDNIIETNFRLAISKNQLKEIIIENKDPVRIKKDTVEFKADSFRTPQTKKIEDLIKGIDGFKVEADGRISYRGKEVKTVLLDGDDLTQDQYQLLTRNLSADVVDKLQVIDNYNKNRIMGNLLESNEAAINLKFKKNMLGKLNGSGSVAGAVEGRYEVDAALVFLKNKFKAIGLLNANTISKDATGLLRYQEFGSQGAMQQREELTKKLVNGAGIITTASVDAPDISREYVLNNNNYFVSPLLHYRINKSIKLAMRTYAVKDRLQFEGINSTQTIIDAQNNWSVFNSKLAVKNRQNISSAIDLSHDNLRKFAGNLNMQIGWVNDKHQFQNRTSGFFTDTLAEGLTAVRRGVATTYSGAVKISNYTVFAIQSNVSYLPETTDFITKTNRLHLFYNINNSFHLYNQQTRSSITEWQNSFSFLNKKGLKTIRYGVITNGQLITIKNKVSGLDSILSSESKKTNFLDTRFLFTIGKQLNGKSAIRFEANSGMGFAAVKTRNQATFFLYKIGLTYKYKIKAFSGLGVSAGTTRELPNVLWFYPSGIISADASVKDGATFVKPIESVNASINFSNFKFSSKFSLLASITARLAKTDYVNNNILVPQYSVTTWAVAQNNRQFAANFDIGFFIFPLNSTVRFRSNSSYSINNGFLNANAVENKFLFTSIYAAWVPNFKWPLGWELNFTKNFLTNKQISQAFATRNTNQTTDILFKLRSKFKGNYYIGTQYNYLQLSPRQQFHLWSIFQNFEWNKNFNIDFTVHNVFNKKLYTQQINSPNSVSQNTFYGIGRYFLCRLNWSF